MLISMSGKSRFGKLPLVGACTIAMTGLADLAVADSRLPVVRELDIEGRNHRVQVGVAASPIGNVYVMPPSARTWNAAASGVAVHEGDQVVTGNGSSMQLLMLDRSVFTVGPRSRIVIEKFEYEAGRKGGRLLASVIQGTLRYVSGAIAKADEDDKDIGFRLPDGILKLFGTSVFITVPEGRSEGVADALTPPASILPPPAIAPEKLPVFVGLLGPGTRNNANLLPGGLRFTSDSGQQTQVLRSGYGFTVSETGGIGPVEDFSPETLRVFEKGIVAPTEPIRETRSEEVQVQGETMLAVSGQTDALGARIGQLGQDGDAQNAGHAGTVNQLAGPVATGVAAGLNGLRAFDVSELAGFSGSAVYQQNGIAIKSGSYPVPLIDATSAAPSDIIGALPAFLQQTTIGSYDVDMNVDFSSRTIPQWIVSNVTVNSLGLNNATSGILTGTTNLPFPGSNSAIAIRKNNTGPEPFFPTQPLDFKAAVLVITSPTGSDPALLHGLELIDAAGSAVATGVGTVEK